jgi:hypothetical protein
VTRDQLKLVLLEEGLTRPQTAAVLDAADAYATTQARAAIDALGYQPPPLVHFYDGANFAKVACGAANLNVVNTFDRGRVSCDRCKTTRAWKAAA